MNIIRKRLLSLKILSIYLIIIAIIGSIILVLIHEKLRLHEIESKIMNNRNIQHDINAVHRYVAELTMSGESVFSWEFSDYETYHSKRICVDSLLRHLQQNCMGFIRPELVDILCGLLVSKEQQLLHLMQVFHEQKKMDSLLISLPFVARQATHSYKVIRKKKGIAGFLGKKETVWVAAPAGNLYALNDKLVGMQEKYRYELENHADILRQKNIEFNRKLLILIFQIDNLVQTAFCQKELQIKEMRQKSFQLMTYILLITVVLLFISYLIIQRDIRERDKSRTTLEEIVRQNKLLLEMRKNIILTISHDIRGPLGSINGSAELAMDIREKKKRNNHLANIQTACHHILHLVNNLLDIYRMNEWKETKNEIPFRPDRLIDRIATGYSCRSNDKGILFTSELSGLNVAVKGDADRIEQILDNLLANAVKFTENGEIRLIAAYENGHLTMEVRDTGIGMSEETLSRIFKPFERAAQKVNAEGFGLGLSITKGLVCLLDGEISVESTIGEGSTFRVVLPLVQIEWNADMENKNLSGRMLLPHRVLVIDDDAVQLAVIKEMLERNGVSCKTCSHVKELVRELRQQNADLILTDIQMPGTNGFNLLKLLRSSYIGNSLTITVLAMTARGDTGNYDFAEAGFAGCINKPFSIQELLSSISSTVPLHDGQEDTVDFKRLTADTENKSKILELFVEEAERDMAEQQEALKTKDRKKLREVLHKMFPVWELLQIDQPLQAYRKLLHDEEADEEDIRQETEKIMAYTRELVLKAQNEIDGYGTENIDC